MKNEKKVSIRLAGEHDIPLIYNMEQEIFPDAWSEAQLRSHWIHGGLILIAEGDDATLRGYAVLKGVLDEWELYRIAIVEKYRRLSIGKMLLRYFLENYTADSPSLTLFLEVRRSNPARLFYSAFGFLELGERKNYYSDGEDCILYSLQRTNS